MKKRMLKLAVCGLFLILSQIGAQAQRIYPNASGYGTDSRGAYQLYKETGNISDLPKILYVNTLDGGNSSTSANSGTLSWCLSQNYPRIILFSVGGIIDWSVLGGDYNWFQLKNPYCNIYGQSAPAPGITIIGGKLHFQGTHDILVQHLKIRPIDNVYTWGKEIDCIGGWAGNHHIVIDHCSFSWSIDELIGFNTANDITFSNCIFSEPLDHNTHPSEGDQYHAMLATLCYVQRFSSIGNLYAHGRLRAPFFNGGTQDIYISNNLIYNVKHGGIYLRDEWNTEALTKMDIVNNYYKPGLNTSSAVNYMVYIRGDVNPGAEFYINGNHSPYTTDQLSSKMVNNEAGIKLQSTKPLTDHKGHVPINAKDVPQYIYKNAGAFHWDRDMTDKRIIQSVIDSNGVIIDSTSQLKNLYININKVTHVLTLPAGPNEDKNGDGFTNIEEWLFRLGSSDIASRNSLISDPDFIPTILTLPVEDTDTGKVIRIEENSTGFCGFTDEKGSIDINHNGYTGDGFANTANEIGVELNWAVRFNKAGTYRFSWKTSGTAIRPANLIINGNVIKNISFDATPDFDTWMVNSTDVTVGAGGAKIILKSASTSGLPNIDNFKVIALGTSPLAIAADCETVLDLILSPVAGNEITIQENEEGFCGFTDEKGSIDTNHIGFTGDGIANTNNEMGVELCWAVHFLTAGTYRFSWKTSGTTIRPADLIINGTVVKNISFDATPDFDTWMVNSTDVTVSAGGAKIILKSTSASGLPNIDNFKVVALETSSLALAANCETVLDLILSPVAGNEITIQENEEGFCGFTDEKGSIDTNHIGFTGNGFANTANETGAELCWAVRFVTAGTYWFSWKTSGTAIRPANLTINGNVIKNISFGATADFDTWMVNSTDVTVGAGGAKIMLIATSGLGLPNIDYFNVLALDTQLPAILTADCQKVENLKNGTQIIQTDNLLNPETSLYDTELSDKQVMSAPIASDNTIKGLTLFPNPGIGKFFIKISDLLNNEYIVKVTIVNISGQVIYKKELNENDNAFEMEFDISNHNKGVYLFNLQTSQNRKVSKSVIVN